MNTITIPQEKTNKHLNLIQYEFIITEIIKHEASNPNKKRNTGKTNLIKRLSAEIGTSVSNIYTIIKDATITVRNPNLTEKQELSALAAFNKRSKNHKIPNNSKLDKAQSFIKLVETEMKSNKLSSVDETINHLKLHRQDLVKGLDTVCTSTFYNYIHQAKVSIKPIDLPRMTSRKVKKKWKTYIPKRQKGTSIELRPKKIETREEFGHWEGDLVTGPRDGSNGAYLTLIERKTRFYYMIPITSKSSKKFICKSINCISFMVMPSVSFSNRSPLITEVNLQDIKILKLNLEQLIKERVFISDVLIIPAIELLTKIVML